MNGFGYVREASLNPGANYTIEVSSIRWGHHSVKDFTVSVYSAEPVTIVDMDGEQGSRAKNRMLNDDPVAPATSDD